MNGKQAAKAAAKHIEELEDYNRKASADIKSYNIVIGEIIAGKSPCKYCEEFRLGECECPEKQDHGCESWWLTNGPVKMPEEEQESTPVEGVLPQ